MIWGKRLELLREVAPSMSKVAFLVPQELWESAYEREVQRLTQQMGISVFGATLGVPVQQAEYRCVLALMAQEQADALLVQEASVSPTNRRPVIELAEKILPPAICPDREYAEAGGLMAHAVDLVEQGRRAAAQIDEILKGTEPGEIPFSQVSKFGLVINLKTAKALGPMMPASLRACADEVIE